MRLLIFLFEAYFSDEMKEATQVLNVFSTVAIMVIEFFGSMNISVLVSTIAIIPIGAQ